MMPNAVDDLRSFDAERHLEQQPGADVEIVEEPGVEHDAGGIAISPLDNKLRSADEIGHR